MGVLPGFSAFGQDLHSHPSSVLPKVSRQNGEPGSASCRRMDRRHPNRMSGPKTLLRTRYAVQRGLVFGADPRQKLDLYVPEGLRQPAPMLLFFYGGGWQGGTRARYRGF